MSGQEEGSFKVQFQFREGILLPGETVSVLLIKHIIIYITSTIK